MNNTDTIHAPIKFIHQRWLDDSSPLNDMRISPFGGITIAYQQVGNNRYHVSYARCNGRDHYCKRIGRNISSGRLMSGDCYEVKIPEKGDRYTEIVQFVNKKVYQEALPHRHE